MFGCLFPESSQLGKLCRAMHSCDTLYSKKGTKTIYLKQLHVTLICSSVPPRLVFAPAGQCNLFTYVQAFSQTLKTGRPEGMFCHKIIRD